MLRPARIQRDRGDAAADGHLENLAAHRVGFESFVIGPRGETLACCVPATQGWLNAFDGSRLGGGAPAARAAGGPISVTWRGCSETVRSLRPRLPTRPRPPTLV